MNLVALTPPLMALARSGLTLQPDSLLAALEGKEADWTDLIALAARHDLIPLLSAGVAASDVAIPQAIQERLRRQARASEMRNCLAWEQLTQLVAAFNRAGLEPTILKGALFAHRYYRSPGLRPFGDLDILVPPADRKRAEQTLLALGYQAAMGTDNEGQEWLSENHFHWVYTLEGGLPVELHWALTRADFEIHFDLEALAQRSRPFSLPEGRAWAFSPEDEIVYLAVHAAKHRFGVPLRHYTDLAVILATSALDWPRLWQQAAAVGAEKAVKTSLGIARELGLLSLPEAQAEQVAAIWKDPKNLACLARYAVEWPYLECPPGILGFLTAPTPGAALRRLRALLFPDRRESAANQKRAGASLAPHSNLHFRLGRLPALARRLRRLLALWTSARAALLMRRLFTG